MHADEKLSDVAATFGNTAESIVEIAPHIVELAVDPTHHQGVEDEAPDTKSQDAEALSRAYRAYQATLAHRNI